MSEIRLTSARKAILELLEQTQDHLTALQIHANLKSRLPSISYTTVYRSLDYLVQHKLITVADIGKGSPVYELVSLTPHHHLVCLNCIKIQQLEHSIVEPFFEHLEDSKDFEVLTNHLVLYGICKDCHED